MNITALIAALALTTSVNSAAVNRRPVASIHTPAENLINLNAIAPATSVASVAVGNAAFSTTPTQPGITHTLTTVVAIQPPAWYTKNAAIVKNEPKLLSRGVKTAEKTVAEKKSILGAKSESSSHCFFSPAEESCPNSEEWCTKNPNDSRCASNRLKTRWDWLDLGTETMLCWFNPGYPGCNTADEFCHENPDDPRCDLYFGRDNSL